MTDQPDPRPARVFVPQVPSRFDPPTQLWVPTVDLTAANKFGEVVVMLPPAANRLHTAPLVAAIKERMADFAPHDYLVAVGDPSLMVIAGCVAARKNLGRLRLLKWDRRAKDYLPTEIQI